MNKEVERRRKRIEMRKKEKLKTVADTNPVEAINVISPIIQHLEDEERYGYEKIMTYDGTVEEIKKPIRVNNFLLKMLISAVLFLSVAIMYQSNHIVFQPVRQFVSTQMAEGFEYMQVIKWYEDTLGDPLAFLPLDFLDKKKTEIVDSNYVLPASGQIIESFGINGQRMTIETSDDRTVVSLQEGLVIFAGSKEEFGKTIVVKNADNSETWYGNLEQLDITLFSRVVKGERIGLVSKTEDNKGYFYLAVKQGDTFINPSKVISFE